MPKTFVTACTYYLPAEFSGFVSFYHLQLPDFHQNFLIFCKGPGLVRLLKFMHVTARSLSFVMWFMRMVCILLY